jgi:hypothetical protein
MHDRNGTELKVGDTVILEGTITQLYGGEDYCNVTIRATSNVRPSPTRFDAHTFNTNELCLTKKAPTQATIEDQNATQKRQESEDSQC